jgi:hypothetical protein
MTPKFLKRSTHNILTDLRLLYELKRLNSSA